MPFIRLMMILAGLRFNRLSAVAIGGTFKTKYIEADEMYSRMMDVSRRLQTAEAAGADPNELAIARDHLYRGQCNCPTGMRVRRDLSTSPPQRHFSSLDHCR